MENEMRSAGVSVDIRRVFQSFSFNLPEEVRR